MDTVVHLVAIIRGRPADFERVMTQGTRNVVAAAQEAGVRRFVLASALGLDERSKDAVPYFAAKWQMEHAVRESGLDHVIFRPSFVFGRDGGVLPTFVRLARLAPVTPIVGPGRQRLQPIWVEDLAEYYALAATERMGTNATFELGGPEAVTWNEFWERLKRVLGVRRPSIHVPFGLMRAQATVTEHFPGAPVSRDQLTMLELGDNVVTDPSAVGDVQVAARPARRAATARVVTRGVVYAEPDAAPAVEELTVDPPGPREVLVRVLACGLCHSDLHVVETKGWHMRFPILLGHEGAGIVEEVGSDVTLVAPGDRVVVAWRAPCGDCPQCRRGDPRRCSSQLRAKRRLHRAADGALLTPVLRCGTFADQAVVHEACAVKVPEELPVEQASLLACGFSTGAGAALWTTPVQQGSSVAVIGCGGVGLAVVQGANAARRRADHRGRRRAGEARARGRPRRDRRGGRLRDRSRRGRARADRRPRRRVRVLGDRRAAAGSYRRCGCAPTPARRRSSACRCPAQS